MEIIMSIRIKPVLARAAAFFAAAALCACSGSAAPESGEKKQNADQVVFMGRSIDPEMYASLIAVYEQMSFSGAEPYSREEFETAAGSFGGGLYELHSFVASLSNADAARLSRMMLDKMQN